MPMPMDEWKQLEERRRHEGRTYRPLYSDWCIPNREWQRCKLEALRYKWGRYKGHGGVMQALGDFARASWLGWAVLLAYGGYRVIQRYLL